MTTSELLSFASVHTSWHACLKNALSKMDQNYLKQLKSNDWLPGRQLIFNAFSLPVNQVKYVLFGESPYPRAQSANGYAFWDQAVTDLWSSTGLSKPVNRATSLRNIIKMLLVTEGLLSPEHTSQPDIANLNKTKLISTNQELFNGLLNHGFLLLNATLVLRPKQVSKDALAWHPFIEHILHFLIEKNPNITLLLFGRIAKVIDELIPDTKIQKFYTEHPYNLSFINNPQVQHFFKPFHLLIKV